MALLLDSTAWIHTRIAKPILFLFDPELVHARMTAAGQVLGRFSFARKLIKALFGRKYPELQQNILGMRFDSPLGLAAGFDYEGRLPLVLPAIGFGFGTIGTLTHRSYDGNPRPMLGRLPKSKSLMVNKGFKNMGVEKTLHPWRGTKFACHVGVSIGKTNDSNILSQSEAVADVCAGFRDAETSGVDFSYYELNISCPNLAGSVEFYSPENLREILEAVSRLNLPRPIFIKMPISKEDGEIKRMLTVISHYPCISGVIFGNLQKDRSHPTLAKEEVLKFPTGNFSGLPCRERSDYLIRLAYRAHKNRFVIIGCGGVFTAEDAYRKIRYGASLVQLITGMVYNGPQLPAQINLGLKKLLRRDGFQTISEAIGMDA